jgi:succinoglycan biosynthesis protein ExoO/succinoglycan biosynthesis protein ExoU
MEGYNLARESGMSGSTRPPAVSVVIPVYNAAAFAATAVASVQRQTAADLEIIVIDDCSTDGTETIVRDLASSEARLRYFRMSVNSGPSACRNLGIEAARGEWIALLDADDAYEPARLENLLRLGREAAADMVSDNPLMCLPDDERSGVLIPRDVLSAPRQMSFKEFMEGCMWGKSAGRGAYVFMKPMFRSDFLLRTGLRYDPRSRNGEDFVLYISCFLAGARWFVTPEPTYRYLVREDSLTDKVSLEDRLLMALRLKSALAEAAVRSDRRLAAVIRRHWRNNSSDYHFRVFKAAVRARDPSAVIRALTESRSALRDVVAAILTRSRIAPGVILYNRRLARDRIAGRRAGLMTD